MHRILRKRSVDGEAQMWEVFGEIKSHNWKRRFGNRIKIRIFVFDVFYSMPSISKITKINNSMQKTAIYLI